MERPTLSNRAALIMSATALVMSAGFAGGPALARAIVANSDKVDGLHAVKATATTAQRKGKLVAADGTGSFKANVIPNDAKFPSTVPPGVTLRGAFSTDAQSTGGITATDYGSAISYGAKMPAPLVLEYSPNGQSTTNCPGNFVQPEAAPGYLCMYITTSGGTTGTLAGSSSVWGFNYRVTSTLAAGNDVYVSGVWAARAPVTVPMKAPHRLTFGPPKP